MDVDENNRFECCNLLEARLPLVLSSPDERHVSPAVLEVDNSDDILRTVNVNPMGKKSQLMQHFTIPRAHEIDDHDTFEYGNILKKESTQ